MWRGKRPKIVDNIEEQQSWGTDSAQLQDLLRNYINEDSVTLVREQANKSMRKKENS